MLSFFNNIVQALYNQQLAASIWTDSVWSNIAALFANNVGLVGEQFLQHILTTAGVEGHIHGVPGQPGDGNIRGYPVEVKTARQGNHSPSFQHELGATPWGADYLAFLDISPTEVYLTLFPNIDEPTYTSSNPRFPLYPNKSITHRAQGAGHYKFDTNVAINNIKVASGNTLRITNETTPEQIRSYIDSVIPPIA
ncbi:MAG: hypothetical protein CMJ26_08790 [Phycisphaerae bacterium]|nr:hypothetical protein [Phycisphaerae bacterium]|tara:strand:- start:46 stop:630 length:585 start_codon:yes stop_codon:yes gene_type:complete